MSRSPALGVREILQLLMGNGLVLMWMRRRLVLCGYDSNKPNHVKMKAHDDGAYGTIVSINTSVFPRSNCCLKSVTTDVQQNLSKM